MIGQSSSSGRRRRSTIRRWSTTSTPSIDGSRRWIAPSRRAAQRRGSAVSSRMMRVLSFDTQVRLLLTTLMMIRSKRPLYGATHKHCKPWEWSIGGASRGCTRFSFSRFRPMEDERVIADRRKWILYKKITERNVVRKESEQVRRGKKPDTRQCVKVKIDSYAELATAYSLLTTLSCRRSDLWKDLES